MSASGFPTETRYTPFAASPSYARTRTTFSTSSFSFAVTRFVDTTASSASSAVFSESMLVRQ